MSYSPYAPDIPAIGIHTSFAANVRLAADIVPDACTLDEAVAFRQRLHAIGKAAFVEETIVRETVTAKKLCTAFGILPPAFLEGAPDEAFHPLLAVAISREFSRRPKLPEYNSIDDAVRLLQEARNVIVLTGAGVCCILIYVAIAGANKCARLDLNKSWYPRLPLEGYRSLFKVGASGFERPAGGF